MSAPTNVFAQFAMISRAKIAELLRPERIGVVLTEDCQLVPEQSTDAIVVHHPG